VALRGESAVQLMDFFLNTYKFSVKSDCEVWKALVVD
jgi:hypothetical protein